MPVNILREEAELHSVLNKPGNITLDFRQGYLLRYKLFYLNIENEERYLDIFPIVRMLTSVVEPSVPSQMQHGTMTAGIFSNYIYDYVWQPNNNAACWFYRIVKAISEDNPSPLPVALKIMRLV